MFEAFSRTLELIAQRGDLAHIVLLLWAMSSTFLAWWLARELAGSTRLYNHFVREIARLTPRLDS